MVCFTIKLELMSRVGAQHSKTFRWWLEMLRRNTRPVKTKDCKTSSSFEKVGSITSTNYIKSNGDIQK